MQGNVTGERQYSHSRHGEDKTENQHQPRPGALAHGLHDRHEDHRGGDRKAGVGEGGVFGSEGKGGVAEKEEESKRETEGGAGFVRWAKGGKENGHGEGAGEAEGQRHQVEKGKVPRALREEEVGWAL